MHTTGIDSRVKIQDLIDNQLPSYIWDENPKAVEFLKQYYISQEYQSGPVDISDNLDNYLKVDNLIPEVVVDSTKTVGVSTETDSVINVSSTKGFPDTYGLIKIDDEIITYTGKTETSFTGCVRGFSGITNYSDNTFSQIDATNDSLIFSSSTADRHNSNQKVQNLSSLFLKEFYKKLKATFTPGFEELKFDDEIHAGNFIKRAKDFYQSKGTNESIEILFKTLYAEKPKVINLENYLIKPSAANYVKRAIVIVEPLSDSLNIAAIFGQTLFKENDASTNASISFIEPFSSDGRNYFKIGLFVGNDENATIFGNFVSTPITKSIESVPRDSSIITVDSTIGFNKTGTFVSEDYTISYTSKSINQFFGCTWSGNQESTSGISTASDIISNDTYVVYENGDLTKPVRFAILNIIDDFTQISENVTVSKGDFVTVKNIGNRISNTSDNEKDIFANSWIYNSSPRYEIKSNSNLTLESPILRSSLKKGDEIDILKRDSLSIITHSKIDDVNKNTNQIFTIGGQSISGITSDLDVRRKINRPISTGTPLEFDSITSDVTNVYLDKDDFGYIASNSLPSGLTTGDSTGIGTDFKFNIETSVAKISVDTITGPQNSDETYNFLRNNSTVPFRTGDRVFYTPETQNLVGVNTGDYFIEVDKVDNQNFKIHSTRSTIGTTNNVTFKLPSGTTHNFILFDQLSEKISGQKILRKIPFSKNIKVGTGQTTEIGTTGILINGVEISNYKSNDKVFFGPLSNVSVLNSNDDVDVINPPVLIVDDPISTGTTALLEPIVKGSIKNVFIDSQNYDVEKIVSVNISGGNGTGASVNPILQKRTRDMFFDASDFNFGGGVDTSTNDRIIFLNDHFLNDGDEIVYSSSDDNLIKVGSGTSSLPNNSSFFVNVVNSKTIELFNTLSDQVSGINKIQFNAAASGIQKFRTKEKKNTISRIDILNEGQNYTYRRLIVDSTGISPTFDTITFDNHGFENGDLIEYSYSGVGIGISTENSYFVLKKDENSFRLCDAGIGGTITSNFDRKDFVNISGVGAGYQYFKYPEVKVEIKYTNVGSSVVNDLITTPVVKGKLVDAYLYKKGTGYGSTSFALNFEKTPEVSVQNGKNGSVGVVISNGSILSSFVSNSGTEFNSVPDLIVEDSSGSGLGGKLRAEISDGKISNVIVINPGFGYSSNSTSVKVVPSGSNIVIRTNIRPLTVNNVENRAKSGELLKGSDHNLQYSIVNYFERLRDSFGEVNNVRSKIIGWSYDGHPIYGPFVEGGSRVESGYVLDTNSVIDRPTGFDAGFFVEDYKFNGSGDLDEHNGRFEINEEFPNGRYVYHATLDSGNKPAFPYFIGNNYNSTPISDYKLDQDFDFASANILRNTQPIRTFEDGVSYDFIREFPGTQRMEIDSVKSGSIDSLEIVESGTDFKVGDVLNFDTLENGSGLLVSVKSIEGEDINDVTSTSTQYLNNTFEWEDEKTVKIYSLPFHNFDSTTVVSISGFSTNLTNLNGQFKIKNPNYFDGNTISTISSSGITTEIYVNQIPDNVSVGNSIGIGTETLGILGIFRNENILRVERGLVGTSHSVGTAVTYFSDFFRINVDSIEKFDSERPRKIFFNPNESIGVGTISGISTNVSFDFGNVNVVRDIPSRLIYIENHNLINNQKIIYTKPAGSANISVSTDGQSNVSALTSPSELFVVNKAPNLIGVKTSINSEQLFFHTNGDDNDKYLFETTNQILKGNFEINKAVVSISTSVVDTHGLDVGDQISLDVNPNLSVGIGTSTSIRIQLKNEKLVINPIGFNSTAINTITNQITIPDHGLKTGDKVFYEDNNFLWIETSDQLDLTAQENTPSGIHFKPDGTKMYVVGSSGDDVNEYILSTPWSVSTASFVSNFSIVSEGSNPKGLYIRDDGLKFWTCESTTDKIYQYSMSTAWDLSTASYDNVSLFVGSGNPFGFTQSTLTGIYFKYDGSVLYLIGSSGDFAHQLDLSTPWDITTASYSGNTTGRLDLHPPDSSPQDIHINSFGTLLYWVGAASDNIYIYELSTPWDISTGTELSRVSLGTGTPTLIYVSPGTNSYPSLDEENLYVIKGSNDIVYRFKRPFPLTGSEYYIFTINKDKFNLCETYFDSQQNPPTVVSFASTGSSNQNISLINPQIQTIPNNDLVFDLSDSTVSGYNLRFYSDRNNENEFVSIGTTTNLVVSRSGTATTISNVSQIDSLYYTLEKDGSLIAQDETVNNYSNIVKKDSEYKNTYTVSGIGSTTFTFFLSKKPEKLSYSKSECDVLEYSTTSKNVKGSVNELKINSRGSEYKALPEVSSITTEDGKNLLVSTNSKTVGDINDIKIIDDSFAYPSDPTLSPEARVSPIIELTDSSTLESITIDSGGRGYTEPPNIIFVSAKSRNINQTGIINPIVLGDSISSLNVIDPPKGLPDESVEVFTTNNSNGISILEVESLSPTSFRITITTPGNGGPNAFAEDPFDIGDKVFIEGITKSGDAGTGFNSSDYGFRFFKVSSFDNSGVNHKVTIDISDFTTNTGTPVTNQQSLATIINKNDYPQFSVITKFSEFSKGERLSVNGDKKDLFVQSVDQNKLKVTGSYELKVTDIIRGFDTGNLGTVKSLTQNDVNFITNFSNIKRIGWSDQIGKLSEDFQVIQNSDYYQNLSYSINSSIPYQKQKSPVENLVHISGLKNFADLEVKSESDSVGISSDNATVIVKDIIDEKRVDTFIFDLARDADIVDDKSKFIELNKKRLTNFTDLKTNEVLKIDDISKQFSNLNSITSSLAKISNISGSDSYENYLIRLNDLQNQQIQLNEITILNSNNNSAIIENEFITNINSDDEYNTSYGNYEIVNKDGINSLVFTPDSQNEKDFDFKILKQTFNTNSIGIGTSSIGCIDLIGSIDKKVTGIGSTNIVSLDKDKFKSIFLTAQVIDDLTKEANFVKIYATHNETNTFISEYYSDTSAGLVKTGIGSFDSNLSGSSFEINFFNESSESSIVKSSVVGIATTANGTGTYRFLSSDQSPGTEKSLIYQSGFTTTSSGLSTSVLSFDKSNFNASRSIIEVTTGSVKSLHQVMMIFDNNDVFVQQSPFLSASVDQYPDSSFEYFDDVTGIGTFGGTQTVSECILNFYPNTDQNALIELISFDKLFHTFDDLSNDPNELNFGTVTEDLFVSQYNSILGSRINKKSFELKTNNVPIFAKKFNPSNNSVVSDSGIFSINNHFFRTGEELTYTPKSSIDGISATSMKMNASDNLPSTVFAIKINDNQFKVATTKSNANAGIGTTIASRGTGNIHQFAATKQNSKCIITIDGLVQFPLSSTNLTYTLNNSIGISTTFVALSGISTINSGDILKVNDEFMEIISVGIGTTFTGPISDSGSFNLINVNRGVLGSSSASHGTSTSSRIFKGSFNIVDSTIHFLEAPKGNPNLSILRDESNKFPDTSDFSGRVFTRSDYTDNKVYDDISDKFTGIGRTFTIEFEGANTIGIGTSGASSILFVNNIFQTPNTNNNTDNNYDVLEDTSAGITTVVFTGIQNQDSLDVITSETDVNLNEVPRGGVIVSLGSTPGLGFAPLVGASVTAVVGAGGSIVSIGLGATDNLGSGYNGLVSIGVSVFEDGHSGTPAQITATANVGAGGTLSFNIVGDGGTGYNNPKVFVSDPSYENLPVIGVSRIGVGATTDTGKGLLLSLELGGGTGIGSTMFEVKNFKISRPGFGFRKGDVIKPIGLTTDKNLTSPINDFELTVLDTYTDNFCAWQFGDLDFIDSIKNLQDGVRTNFPLKYEGTLLSFETNNQTIRDNFSNVLIIFVNGVLQDPGTSYTFDGGTSFRFEEAPKSEDRVAIYFYKGTSGVDSELVTDILPILEQGDDVKLLGDSKTIQNERSVYDLSFARKFETNLYTDQGINDIDFKSLLLIKQKRDKKINGVIIDKSRNTLTSQIYPTAKIIKDVSTTDNEIFVDDADLFKYGLDPVNFNGLLVDGVSGVGTAFENISNFTQVSGFSGIITGISTSTGISTPLALNFEIYDASSPSFVGLETGNPIYIFDTIVGNGVTSIDNSDSAVVGVGTTFVDNIYYISDYSTSGNLGIITCNVKSDSSIIGLGTTGSISNPVGKYSWGKLAGTLSRSNPVSIGVSGRNASGLSTFPTIQRRDVGHRKTGSLFPT